MGNERCQDGPVKLSQSVLGMPLHTQAERCGLTFDGLDHTIIGARGYAKLPRPHKHMAMKAVHLGSVLACQLAQPQIRRKVYAMDGPIGHDLGNVP